MNRDTITTADEAIALIHDRDVVAARAKHHRRVSAETGRIRKPQP